MVVLRSSALFVRGDPGLFDGTALVRHNTRVHSHDHGISTDHICRDQNASVRRPDKRLAFDDMYNRFLLGNTALVHRDSRRISGQDLS